MPDHPDRPGPTTPVGPAAHGGFGSFGHLAVRFFGALDPRGPGAADDGWAQSWLVPGEQALWGRMSGPDRRHAVGVARDVLRRLGEDPGPGREVVAAALLHDVGKVESGLGTFARVAVTLAAMGVGRERLTTPPEGSDEAGWRLRVRQYLVHDRLGADLLEAAGSDPMTVAWAAEHHRDPATWSVEPRVAAALKAADGD